MSRPRRPPLALQAGESVKLDQHGTRKTYFLIVTREGGRRFVECHTTDWKKAKDFEERFRRGLSTFSPFDLDIADVLRNPPVHLKPMKEWRRRILLAFWEGLRVGDVAAHVAAFRASRIKRNGEPVKDGSVRLDLAELARFIRAAGKMHHEGFVFDIDLPDKSPSRERWLRGREVARFLWAVRGRIWVPDVHATRLDQATDKQVRDEAAGAWLTDPATGRRILRDAAAVDRRRPLARLILLGLYTASRLEVMENLRWRPGGEHGHVDDEDPLHLRLYREGPEATKRYEARYPKRSPAAIIVPRLAVHMFGSDGTRGWKQRDRAECGSELGHVIHDGTGARLSQLVEIWNEVLEDAGLARDGVLRHTLRHTAITRYLELGATPDEVADLAGLDVRPMLRIYAQVEAGFTDSVAEAVDRHVRADPAKRAEVVAACASAKAARVGTARRAGGRGHVGEER